MIRVIMHGCNGHMGKVIASLASGDPDVEIVAGIDVTDDGTAPFPVFGSLKECPIEADVVVDFSTAKAVDALLDACEERKLPVVVCTTGLSKEQLSHLTAVSRKTAVLKSANMSVGINLLQKLLKEAALKLFPAGFDIEVLEKHHNQKVDAPSGTALALADSVNEALGGDMRYVYDRTGVREKRTRDEIGIFTIRGGNIVGEHEVIFAGTDEVITFKHTAYSKAVFAKGALEAAKFLAGRESGLYDMSDVIG